MKAICKERKHLMMKTKGIFGMLLIVLFALVGLTACSDDDDDNTENPDTPETSVRRGIYDVKVDYFIEVDDKSGIEADLEAGRPLPEGAKYGINWQAATLELVNGTDTTVIGDIKMRNLEESETMPETYKLLPPDKNVSGWRRWEICTDGSVLATYDAFFNFKYYGGDMMINEIYLYEDLTGKYNDMFPEAGVTAVVRRQTLAPIY